jgi:hypothetical protein
MLGKEFERIVLVPHINKDLTAINNFISFLPDKIARESVVVAGLDTNKGFSPDKFLPYLSAKMVIASRFHANVCALSLGVPVLPIVTYPQISKTFEKLPVTWDFPLYNITGNDSLHDLVNKTCQIDPQIYFDYSLSLTKALLRIRDSVGEDILKWLETNNLSASEEIMK